MSTYSKYNVIYRLQKWMDSVPGQTFLNYAYSWGASIVILGTLFKLTHLPGANIMLFIGMGTEVFVFFLSAFDRPFDKTDDGKELPTHIDEEEIEKEYEEQEAEDEESGSKTAKAQPETISFPEGTTAAPAAQPLANKPAAAKKGEGTTVNVNATMPTADQIAAAMVNQQSQGLGQAQGPTPEMVEAQTDYVDALKNLTEMLGKVNEQSQRLTRDSEEMENLNRTLTGISKIYEMQLKGASLQVGTIDQINEQTRKMAQQIEQLNNIYARMIEAMTVNMHVAAPGSAPGAAASQQSAANNQ